MCREAVSSCLQGAMFPPASGAGGSGLVQFEPEPAALAGSALDAYRAPEAFNRSLDECESHPRAGVLLPGFQPLEEAEQLTDILRGDADAVIPDPDAHE